MSSPDFPYGRGEMYSLMLILSFPHLSLHGKFDIAAREGDPEEWP
jgi:hypothetical protein